MAVQRVAITGCSGSGKTTLGRRLAGALGVEFRELDALCHRPGWTPSDPDEFVAAVSLVASGER